jgi:tRNA(Arg) A34 adenosine deaminase TadA
MLVVSCKKEKDNMMAHFPTEIHLTMPDWWAEEMARLPTHLATVEERMAAVLRFARLNFARGTGGPFAAGVFERDTGKLLVIGVNRVMPTNCSSAHAEVMTLSLAQKLIGHYDLGASGQPVHQLVVNWLPCAMCFGATLWSGIRSLVIAGDGPELEQLTGFDEGPIHPEWPAELQKRGIELINNVLREEACAVYRDFGRSNAFVYNARLGV